MLLLEHGIPSRAEAKPGPWPLTFKGVPLPPPYIPPSPGLLFWKERMGEAPQAGEATFDGNTLWLMGLQIALFIHSLF